MWGAGRPQWELGLAAYHSLLSLTRSLEMLMALFSIVELLVSSIRPLFVLQHQLPYLSTIEVGER